MHVCRPPVPVAEHFCGKSTPVRTLYRAVRAALRAVGPVHIDSTKTRIAFALKTIFLELTPQVHALRGCLVLPRPARHRTFQRVISLSPRIHYHYFVLSDTKQIDSRFRRLLAEGFKVGRREHLLRPLAKTGRFPATLPEVTGRKTSRPPGLRARRRSPPTLPARQPRQPAGGTLREQKPPTGGPEGPPRRTAAPQRTLWRCPKCGNYFVSRNLWHSCVRVPLDRHFRGKHPLVRRTFNALVAALRRNGPLRVVSSKTRITVMVRMRFAGVHPQKNALRGTLILTRRARHPRIFRYQYFPPRYHLHHFLLTDSRQLDARFRRLLAEAYQVGQQKHLHRG